MTTDANQPCSGGDQSTHHFNGSGFSSTIGTKETKNLSSLDYKIKIIYSRHCFSVSSRVDFTKRCNLNRVG